MYEAGTSVVASVQAVHPYGIYFTPSNATILVLITDISDERERTREIMSNAKIGDQWEVRIVAPYTDRSKWYAGTLKSIKQA